jgi:hypothetical protein
MKSTNFLYRFNSYRPDIGGIGLMENVLLPINLKKKKWKRKRNGSGRWRWQWASRQENGGESHGRPSTSRLTQPSTSTASGISSPHPSAPPAIQPPRLLYTNPLAHNRAGLRIQLCEVCVAQPCGAFSRLLAFLQDISPACGALSEIIECSILSDLRIPY